MASSTPVSTTAAPATGGAAKSSSSLLSATMAALRGASPDEASSEETTDPSNAQREDSGDDFVPGESGVTAGGDDSEDELGLTGEDDGDEEADVDLDAQAEEVDSSDEADGEESEETEDEATKSGVREVDVTDDLGRRKVKVDFSNIDYMTKVVQQAAGARKLMRQVIPDLKKQVETLTSEATTHKEDAGHFKALADAWDKDGIQGLVQQLTKGKQSWDDVYAAEKARREQLASMSPAEKRAYEAEQRTAVVTKEKSEAEKRFEDMTKQLAEKEEKAERATLQGYMETNFHKSRFAGTLGDEAREHELDELLWDGVRAAIAKLPDDVSVTPTLIAQTFARKAGALKKTIESEAGKKAKETTTKRKVDAKTAAQSTMRAAASGKPRAAEQDFRKQMKSGNLVSAVTDFLVRNKKK